MNGLCDHNTVVMHVLFILTECWVEILVILTKPLQKKKKPTHMHKINASKRGRFWCAVRIVVKTYRAHTGHVMPFFLWRKCTITKTGNSCTCEGTDCSELFKRTGCSHRIYIYSVKKTNKNYKKWHVYNFSIVYTLPAGSSLHRFLWPPCC